MVLNIVPTTTTRPTDKSLMFSTNRNRPDTSSARWQQGGVITHYGICALLLLHDISPEAHLARAACVAAGCSAMNRLEYRWENCALYLRFFTTNLWYSGVYGSSTRASLALLRAGLPPWGDLLAGSLAPAAAPSPPAIACCFFFLLAPPATAPGTLNHSVQTHRTWQSEIFIVYIEHTPAKGWLPFINKRGRHDD